MGRDGTVVEIREDAERAWLFKVGDWIVAAMDEFFCLGCGLRDVDLLEATHEAL